MKIASAHPAVLTLGHSPDPDDAFMFYAMAAEKIDLRGYRFEHVLQDIETLNQRATRGELHVSAVSVHALAYVLDKYALLSCGASMGDGYGPLVVRRAAPEEPAPAGTAPDHDQVRAELKGKVLAVPGKMTSAFLTLQLYLGATPAQFRFVPFDQIFEAVRTGQADAGLLIHEGQLTYAAEGFRAVVDLGIWWQEQTGLPLPLGGNVVRKDLPPTVRGDVSEIMRASIDYGLAHRSAAVRHSMPLARGMDEPLADQFIGMYVNELTRDYGVRGREAVTTFLRAAHQARLIPAPVELEFV